MAAEDATTDTLEASLKRGKFSTLYLFHGEESFLIDEALHMLVNAAIDESQRAFNLDVVSANDVDARDIVARASAFPMMADRRVVVVRDVERLAERDMELLRHYVETPSATTCLVCTAAKADMRRKLFTTIKKNGVAIEFKELYENQLPSWIDQRVRKRKGTITPEAAKLVAAYVGSSLRDIENELEKLFLYLGGRTEITADDVATVVGFTREYNVFELQKAVGEKNLRRAAAILERILDAGERLPLLISVLTSYFATLWKMADLRKRGVAERDLAAEVRVNPYFLREYLDVLRRYSLQEIEMAFEHLVTADEQSKSTGSDPKQIMHLLLVRLTGAEHEEKYMQAEPAESSPPAQTR
jgi:DNA polymerase-3 subunit delta